jgi:hypothetical protein
MALKVRKFTEPLHPEMEAIEWVHHAKDEVLACRGQGHNWPKLKPNKGRPIKGIRHRIVEQGQVEITMTCKDGCGKERRVITPPSGLIDLPAKYHYNNPDDYSPPRGTKVTGRMAFAESNRRWLEEVKQTFEGVPPTMFSEGE